MSEKLVLHTFGGWRIERDGAIDTAVGSRKVEALFIYLAVTARPHPRELLAELLWDDRSQKVAMSNLRRVLTGLRQHFGDHVTITRETAVCHPNLWLDVHELQTKLAPLTTSNQALSAQTVAEAETALALYQGEFLAGFTVREAAGFESWLIAEHEHWQQQVLTTLATLATYYESAQLFPQGIAAAQRAIQIDGLQETAHQQLIRLLTLNGRRSDALAQYETCRQLLWDELGVRPAPETDALYEAIMAGELTAVSTQFLLVEKRRAKDEERKDRPSPLALPPSSSPHHNLPLHATLVIGREKELTALNQLITNPNTRLITIVGAGGMGKTRLALALAEQLVSTAQFANGIFFVNLAPLSEARHIVSTLAEALGYQLIEGGNRSPQQQLLDYLRQQKLLLLFDNFEHLLDGVDLVTAILQAAPEIKILATSRERLHLRIEQAYPIEGLEFPDWETPEDAEEHTAVQLFLQSARRNQPDFTLHNSDDLTYLARICRTVAGMPLALELAASWVDMLPLSEIAAELQQGLDFLETDMRDMPERHHSIRAAIDYSWQKLDEQERDVFAGLSVFRGGFAREAAQAVAGANLRQLSRLANKSFLQFDKANGRYQIHELLRQYGDEKLAESGELEAVRDVHNDYFLNFVHQREADIKGLRQLAAFHEIEADFENIRFAWLRAAQHQNYQGIDRALEGLMLYFVANQLWADGIDWQQYAMSELAPKPGQNPHPVWYHVAARHQRPRENEIPLLQEALALARQQNDQSETAYCLCMLGWASVMTGDFENGLSYLEDSVDICRALSDPFYLPFNLALFALASLKAGRIKQAYTLYQECVLLWQKIGDKAFSARNKIHLGGINFRLGHFEASEKELLASASQYRQFGQIRFAARIFLHTAHMSFLRGQFAEAITQSQESATLIGEIDDALTYGQQDIKGLLANLRGEYGLAREILSSSEIFQASLKFTLFEWMAAWNLAVAAYGLGDYIGCKQEMHQALSKAINRQEKGGIMLSLPVVALLLAKAQNSIRAVEVLALAFQELVGWTGWLEKWMLFTQLRSDLEAACGATAFAQAWQRGQRLDLWQTAESLLTELAELGWGDDD
jgi:predicted ATPase/DNA-binding SARP family transcriptional activator